MALFQSKQQAKGSLQMETYLAQVRALMALATGDEKHDQSAHSTLDVLWVLYDRILHYNEGSIWESLLLAANQHLSSLTCIVIDNHSGIAVTPLACFPTAEPVVL
jgi:transketolase N-terminal domain/subunit